MRVRRSVVAGAVAGVVLATGMPAIAKPPEAPQAADAAARIAPGATARTAADGLLPRQRPPDGQSRLDAAREGPGAAQAQPLQITVTDGVFTDDDPRVAFRVEGCTSEEVDAASVAFTATTYDAATNVLTARISDSTQSGTIEVTFTCTGLASQTERYEVSRGAAEPEPDPEISISFTDGSFTGADTRIRFRVRNCRSNDVRARSPIFSRSSYNRRTRMVTANIEEGTRTGSYRLVVTCRGQATLRTEARITASGLGGDSDGDGEGDFPVGGIDTGGGGAAADAPGRGADAQGAGGIPPAAGWLLLLLAIPSLIYLLSSGRLTGRRNLA